MALVHAQARPTLLAAAAFTVAAPLGAMLPHRTGSWLPLHLLFVGALLSAISGATQLLAVTWAAAPAPPAAAVTTQRALIVLGAVGLAVGREAGDRPAVLVPAGSAVVAGLLVLGLLLTGIRRHAVQRRFDVAIDHYLAAVVAGVAGCVAGTVLAGGWAAGATARLREAHLSTNLLGLVGLVVAGTLPYFTATQGRLKLGRRRGAPSGWVTLGGFVAALAVADVGLLVGDHAVAGVGLAGYAAGLVGVALQLPRLGAKQLRWGGPRLAMLLAGLAWWTGCVVVATWRAWQGDDPFPSGVVDALAIGGFGQILVGSLAYFGPVLRGGGHERLVQGFRTTRAAATLVGLNVAAAAASMGAGRLVAGGVVVAVLDGGARGVGLLARRAPAAPRDARHEPRPERYNVDMQTDETRQLVQRFIEARAANDRDGLGALLADDAEWHPPVSAGFGPFTGRDTVAAALSGGAIGRLFDIDTVQRTVHRLIVEGDTAVALQRMTATTRRGAAYANEYCWVYTCRDGKVARLDEYADTLNAARILGTVKS